jgi:VanZ family protein
MCLTGSPPFKKFIYYWLPVLLYCLLIFIQSSFPASEHVPEFDFSDKLLHAAAYAVLGLLLYRALNAMDRRIPLARLIALSACLTALYGASDEIHQYFVPSRSAEFLDFAADAVGGILGVMAATVILKNRQPFNV